MSVTILGGALKGIKLLVPRGSSIRPTSVMLRRRVFDKFQCLEGYIFVDLCAGTGAMGIEALSRGAKAIYLIEESRTVFSFLKKNASQIINKRTEQLPIGDIRIDYKDYRKWMTSFERDYKSWDSNLRKKTILFFDPPYGKIELYRWFLEKVLQKSWFEGVIWIESDTKKGVKSDFFDSCLREQGKLFTRGDTYLLIYP